MRNRPIRPLVVKVEKVDRECSIIHIHYRTGKNALRLIDLKVYTERDTTDPKNEYATKLNLGDPRDEGKGQLCDNCNTVIMHLHTAGALKVSDTVALCGMCASREEIVERYNVV